MTPRPSRPSLRLRALAFVATAAVAIAACQATASPSTTPTATSTPSPEATPRPTEAAASVDPAEVYAEIEAEVTRIRGLDAENPVDPVILDEAGIRELTEKSVREDNPPELMAANERLLKGLGLLPEDDSLEDLYVELLGSQVAGLYSPDDKELYVVSRSGDLGPTEKSTFAHEFTHALQDQNFGIEALDINEVGEGDRGIARLSLVEGDATLAMSYWQIESLSQLELLRLIGESLNPEISGSLDEMPAILRESLLFPYVQGLTFVQSLQAAGGWQEVNDAYADPPASTEQILHPEAYVAGELPVDVELPDDLAARMGEGWSVGLEDTFGELQLRIWLDQSAAEGGVDSTVASTGWGGDRIALLDGPDGSWAIVIETAWDGALDATEFTAGATAVLDEIDGSGEVIPGADDRGVTVLLGSGDDAVDQLRSALGR